MKWFYSENSKAITKFIVTHIVMSVLGIMVGLAVLAFEDDKAEGMSLLAVIGSVFTIGFMCFMHYDDMYFIAGREGIRERAENIKPDRLKGLKITLFAYAPTLAVALISVILHFAASDSVSAVGMLFYYAFQGSFLALYKLREMWGYPVYVAVTLLPAIISSVLGYAMGYHDKTLRGLFGMKVDPPYDGPTERMKGKKTDTK